MQGGFKSKRGEIVQHILHPLTVILFCCRAFFNPGFGEKNHKTKPIDDLVATNNGDSQKILATVTSTLFKFTDHHPAANALAIGSTLARTRLYRIGITNNPEAIEKD